MDARLTRAKGLAHVIAVAGVVAVVGCAPVMSGLSAGSVGQPGVTLEGENNHWLDMRIYAVRSGTRYRVGTVNGLSRGRLTIPRAFAGPGGEIRLMGDPIGSPGHIISDVIYLPESGTLQWWVQSSLNWSTLTIRH